MSLEGIDEMQQNILNGERGDSDLTGNETAEE
jgi:hypothetical protein